MINKLKKNIIFLIFSYILLIVILYFSSFEFFLSDFKKIESEQNRSNISTVIKGTSKNSCISSSKP